jgi:hypothetical protein
MFGIQVKEVVVKTIENVNLTPTDWDPTNLSGSDTNRWHKAKLLNNRVVKNYKTMDAVQFYMDMARFAAELGFGDINVIVAVTEHIYDTRLIFDSEEQVA